MEAEPRHRRLLSVVAAMSLAVAIMLPCAVAQASFTAPIDVADQGGAGELATGADGDSTVYWSTGRYSNLHARTLSNGGALGPDQVIQGGVGLIWSYRVDSNASGDSIAIWHWSRSDGPRVHLRARQVSGDGAVGPRLTLSRCRGEDVVLGDGTAHVAIAANGRALASWSCWGQGSDAYRQATMISPGGDLGPILDVDICCMTAAGNAFAVVTREQGALARRWVTAAGTLGPPRVFSVPPCPGETFGYVRSATNSRGDSVFVWQVRAWPTDRFMARTVARDRAMGPVLDLSGAGPVAQQPPDVVIDEDGNAVAAWTRSQGAGGQDSLHARTISSASTLGPLLDLDPRGASAASLATDTAGGAVALWARTRGGQPTAVARTIPATGSVGPIQALSEPGSSYPGSIATDAEGNAIASWTVKPGRPQVAFGP